MVLLVLTMQEGDALWREQSLPRGCWRSCKPGWLGRPTEGSKLGGQEGYGKGRLLGRGSLRRVGLVDGARAGGRRQSRGPHSHGEEKERLSLQRDTS